MKGSFTVLAGFFRKELSQTLRDPVMRVFLFVAPVLQLMVFGYAITNEFRNIRLAVLYRPGDAAARQLEAKFTASRWFLPPSGPVRDPEDYLRSGRADAVLVFPKEGLTRAMGRGEARVQLLIDAQNATKARAVENYVQAVVRGFSAELLTAGVPASPVQFDVRILYNPTMETAFFMVPGVMTMIICLVTIMLTGMSFAREKEMGTLETIIAAPLGKTEIILGKTLPFVALGIVDALLIIAAGVLLFDVPLRGSLGLLLLTTTVFVFTTVGVGTLISTFSRNQQQAMMGSFLFIFPANLLSGIMFPVENMPAALRVFAYLDPLMYYVRALRNIMLKGANPDLVWSSIGVLALMTLAIVWLTVARFRQTLN